ncbi:MAG: chloride channel protein [Thermoplasmata archaeon]
MSFKLKKFNLGFLLNYSYLRKWTFLGILIGIMGGVITVIFYYLIELTTKYFLTDPTGYVQPSSHNLLSPVWPYNIFLIPIIMTLGGLIVGILVYKYAPEAEGHGTDATINAFHRNKGRIRYRVPLIKVIASAITIGSGGSAGREGPTALSVAGFGSVIASILKLSDKDRAIAVSVGIGAGIGAMFKSPFGGAIFGAEVLYKRDFESEAILPSFIASVVSYSIFGAVYGYQPIFIVPGYTFTSPLILIYFAILGVLMALFGRFYIRIFYGTKLLFSRLKVPKYTKPAIGGFFTGLIALFFPQIMGIGYGWIRIVVNGQYSMLFNNEYITVWYILILLIISLSVFKIFATSFTVASGGSGGVFAPALFEGAMLGNAFALIMVHFNMPYFPDNIETIAAFTIVGMMAFFGGVGRVPISVILMVSEMTGNYQLLLPAMISVTISYYLIKDTIYRSQVETRADSPVHELEYVKDPLSYIPVLKVLKKEFITISSNSNIEEYDIEKLEKNVIAVVDDKGRFINELTKKNISKLAITGTKNIKIGSLPYDTISVVRDTDSCAEALKIIINKNIDHVWVLNKEDQPLGYVTLESILNEYISIGK